MSTVVEALPKFEISGPPGAPVVLALGGISATRHVLGNQSSNSRGWWSGVAGPGGALDPDIHRILGVDFIDGGRGVDGRPAEIVTTRDQAASIVALLDDLGIEHLHAVVGASYGGMVALALAERWPERVEQVVAISAAHESHAMATALRAIQRRIVEFGLSTGRAEDGMSLGRALAMTTYRSATEFSGRFTGTAEITGATATFDVERYLVHAGERFATQMAPHRFLALSLSADLHRVVPEDIRVPVTIAAASGDTLVPPASLQALHDRLPLGRGFHVIETDCGHDAFLTEPAQVSRIITHAIGQRPT